MALKLGVKDLNSLFKHYIGRKCSKVEKVDNKTGEDSKDNKSPAKLAPETKIIKDKEEEEDIEEDGNKICDKRWK